MAVPADTVSPGDRLNELALALANAKIEETKARSARLRIEDEIISIVGCKDEGSTNIHTDDFRVTTTGRITRSVDEEKLKAAREADVLPAPLLNRLFRVKHSIDLKELKFIEMNEPNWYRYVTDIITSKPGKPGVTVKDAG